MTLRRIRGVTLLVRPRLINRINSDGLQPSPLDDQLLKYTHRVHCLACWAVQKPRNFPASWFLSLMYRPVYLGSAQPNLGRT